jgi:phage gpG-like protein
MKSASRARPEGSEIANGLTGDWGKASYALEQFSTISHQAAEKETRKAGIIAADAVKKYIRSQPPSWPPLKQATIDRKHSSMMLIDHGDLVNSITHQVTTPTSVFVGVLKTAKRKSGKTPLVNIARVHEYGFYGMVTNSKTGTTYLLHIPARSFLRPTLRHIEPFLRQAWIESLKQTILDCTK